MRVRWQVTAGFGPELPREGIASEVVWPVPVDACQPVSGCVDLKSPPASWASFDPAKQPGRRSTKELCAGAIIMIRRGNCDFFKKILNAQAVGAAAVVVYGNTESEELITMAAEPDEVGTIDIPSVYVTKKTGETLVGAHVMLNMTGELPMGVRCLGASVPFLHRVRIETIALTAARTCPCNATGRPAARDGLSRQPVEARSHHARSDLGQGLHEI